MEEKHSSALNHRGLIKYCALSSPELIFFTYFTNCLLITITRHNNYQFGILISISSIAISIFPYTGPGPLKQGELVLSTNYVSLLHFTRFYNDPMTYISEVAHTLHSLWLIFLRFNSFFFFVGQKSLRPPDFKNSFWIEKYFLRKSVRVKLFYQSTRTKFIFQYMVQKFFTLAFLYHLKIEWEILQLSPETFNGYR